MSKERQLRKQGEIKNIILDAARDIISRDGVKGLSIRKITNAIEYSPAIVYHYFKDKNEVVETLLGEGYGRILNAVTSVAKNELEPEKEIKEIFINYIKAALGHRDEYMAIMLNDDPGITKNTTILEKGISNRSPAMKRLIEILQRGIDLGRFSDCDVELTAQILWTAAFGLIIKLMVERKMEEEHINSLVEQHFKVLFYGIMKEVK